jgi:hypothetical protein
MNRNPMARVLAVVAGELGSSLAVESDVITAARLLVERGDVEAAALCLVAQQAVQHAAGVSGWNY